MTDKVLSRARIWLSSPVASVVFRSKAVILLLLIHWLLLIPLFLWVYVWAMFCYAILCVLSSFAIILMGKRELVALL